MKAFVYERYGPPNSLQMRDVKKPEPAFDEVLIKVIATSVNRTDCATIQGVPFFARLVTGFPRPKKKIPGTAFAGEIIEVGKQISAFKPGDLVFGFNDEGAMAHAEFLCSKINYIQHKPENVTFEQAAVVGEGAHYAYNFINKVALKPGQLVLVNGATGAIGNAAIQLLHHFGTEVIAVCDGQYAELITSIGANRIIDYKSQDFTQLNLAVDYVFDTVGKSSFMKTRGILKHGGVYISSDLGFLAQNIFLPLVTPVFKRLLRNQITRFPVPTGIESTLKLIQTLMEDNEFIPLIDRRYPFSKLVDAYQYVEKGHKKGNVVIQLEN